MTNSKDFALASLSELVTDVGGLSYKDKLKFIAFSTSHLPYNTQPERTVYEEVKHLGKFSLAGIDQKTWIRVVDAVAEDEVSSLIIKLLRDLPLPAIPIKILQPVWFKEFGAYYEDLYHEDHTTYLLRQAGLPFTACIIGDTYWLARELKYRSRRYMPYLWRQLNSLELKVLKLIPMKSKETKSFFDSFILDPGNTVIKLDGSYNDLTREAVNAILRKYQLPFHIMNVKKYEKECRSHIGCRLVVLQHSGLNLDYALKCLGPLR